MEGSRRCGRGEMEKPVVAKELREEWAGEEVAHTGWEQEQRRTWEAKIGQH